MVTYSLIGNILSWHEPLEGGIQVFFRNIAKTCGATNVRCRSVHGDKKMVAEYVMRIHSEEAFEHIMAALDKKAQHDHVIIQI